MVTAPELDIVLKTTDIPPIKHIIWPAGATYALCGAYVGQRPREPIKLTSRHCKVCRAEYEKNKHNLPF